MSKLHNRIAVVTGSAHGIGEAIAYTLAREGAMVIIADIDEVGSIAIADQIRQRGGMAEAITIDVRREEDHLRLLEHIRLFGPIDILVNNVGIGMHQGGLLQLSPTDGENIVRTNILGPLFLTKRVAQTMIDQQCHGSILFTSSIHAQISYPDPVYAASKAMIESLVENLAIELAPYSIRVNAISPGAIQTGKHPATHRLVPLEHRRGTPQEVAEAVAFLVSEQASYITGTKLIVDGGLRLVHAEY